MALTQAQWFEKLKGFVPAWYFEQEHYQVAHFQALALLLSQAQEYGEERRDAAFITTGTDPELDLQGYEVNVDRLPGEFDSLYRPRIQSLANQVNRIAIKRLVDALLIMGQSVIVEDFDADLFFDRDIYADRGYLLVTAIYNTFTIVVENQKHSPYSFMDREYFNDREDFIGTNESPQSIFDAIVAAVNQAKAFGVLYRVAERIGA